MYIVPSLCDGGSRELASLGALHKSLALNMTISRCRELITMAIPSRMGLGLQLSTLVEGEFTDFALYHTIRSNYLQLTILSRPLVAPLPREIMVPLDGT